MKSLPIRLITLITIILTAALFRLVPHWPNFTPIAALVLFGAATFERKWLGLVASLGAMLLSDALIGFHASMAAVYVSFGLTWLLGVWAFTPRRSGKLTGGRIAATSVTASVGFFLITNFAVWYSSPFYPQNFPGLITCYVSGLAFYNGTSFFLNGLLGDLFYSAILFGGYYLLQLRFGELRPVQVRK